MVNGQVTKEVLHKNLNSAIDVLTRKEKKSKGSRQRKINPDSSLSEELCSTCSQEDPFNDSVDLVNWISCD